MRIMALSGSLRARSLNTAMLEAAEMLAPAGFQIGIFRGLGGLPPFNPDTEDTLPAPVAVLRQEAAQADALLIACPEYAGGIPGMFKNALDWLVGCERFNSRPVMLVNVSPHAVEAEAALRLVLKTMSAPVVETASRRIPVRDRSATAIDLAADPAVRAALLDGLDALARALGISAHDEPDPAR